MAIAIGISEMAANKYGVAVNHFCTLKNAERSYFAGNVDHGLHRRLSPSTHVNPIRHQWPLTR